MRNYLYLPIGLSAGSTNYGTIAAAAPALGAGTATLTLPSSVAALSYAVQPLTYTGSSSTIPNELTGEVVQLGTTTSGTLGVTNVVAGTSYVFPALVNTSGASVVFAVARGATVQCLGTLAETTTPSYWGYYQLTPSTEFRIYPVGSACAQGGYFLSWNNSALSGFEVNSGYIGLSASYPPVEVAGIVVTPSAQSLQVGQTQQITATPKDAGGNALLKHPVSWSSSNPTVATVSTSGVVTAAGAGTTTVTASSFGFSASSSITVTAPTVNSITVCDLSITTGCRSVSITLPGQTVNVRATALSIGGVDLTSSCSFVWTTSAPGVVTVTPSSDTSHRDALISRLLSGSVTVTATCGGKSGSFSP